MRKWVVANLETNKLDLVASRDMPANAICQAPESYTREMAPFFKIEEVVDAGQKRMAVSLDEKLHSMMKAEKIEAAKEDFERQQDLIKAIKKQKKKEIHNSLNPAQRFAYSILGDLATEASNQLIKGAMKAIFKDKLGGL